MDQLCRSASEPREAFGECGQLAGAFGPPTAPQSGSKLHALRDIRLRLSCALRREISGLAAMPFGNSGAKCDNLALVLFYTVNIYTGNAKTFSVLDATKGPTQEGEIGSSHCRA